jgi:hypothetical protein
MKKFTASVVLAISLFAITSSAFAEREWDKLTYRDSALFKESYALTVGRVVCIIMIPKNGDEISIYSTDYAYRGTMILCQVIIIDSVNRTIERSAFEVRDDKIFSLDILAEYDIFREKFIPHAKKLPPEVRAMFDGHWGIK